MDITDIMESTNTKNKKCPKGTRKNRKTGNCDPIKPKKDSKKNMINSIPPIVSNIANFGLQPLVSVEPVLPKPIEFPNSIIEPVQPYTQSTLQSTIDPTTRPPNQTIVEPLTETDIQSSNLPVIPINPLTGHKRCPNGSRKNPKTGLCESSESKNISLKLPNIDPLTGHKRCPNGSRKNPKTGLCESKNISLKLPNIDPLTGRKRCPNGSRRNRKTGNCDPNKGKNTVPLNERKRCPNGTRKNRKTGLCESTNTKEPIKTKKNVLIIKNTEPDNLPLPPIPLNESSIDMESENKTLPEEEFGNETLPEEESENKTLKEPEDSIKEPTIENEELIHTDRVSITQPSPQETKSEGSEGSNKIGESPEGVKTPESIPAPPMFGIIPSSLKPEDFSKEFDKQQFKQNSNESKNFKELFEYKINEKPSTDEFPFLYPDLNDPNFNTKIAKRKEFNDFRYDGNIYDIKEQSNTLCHAEFELFPHQIFVKNFLSLQTPYNSLLLYHGLGTGKTCSAIGIAEENRKYMKQVGLNKHKIIIIASPNVQDNFRLQLFNERKLKQVNGVWNIQSCIGNTFINEINPSQLTGMSREKVISSINSIITTYYDFMGYIEFSNYASKRINAIPPIVVKEKERERYRIKNIKKTFNNRFIIVDEVHNIRLVDDNKNKSTAKFLFQIAEHSDNLRLLLLSATPMYNSYREIVWLVNLLNINDKRSQIKITDVFDKDGNFKEIANPDAPDNRWKENGKSLLIRKLTGYVSYVRSENPYSFPFRIYKTRTDIIVTPPKYQINESAINSPLQYVPVYYTNMGETQEKGYNMIVTFLKNQHFIKDSESNDTIETGTAESNSMTGGGFFDFLNKKPVIDPVKNPNAESVKTDPRPESTTPESVKTEFETTPRPESTTPESVKTEFETTPRPESVKTDPRPDSTTPESVKTEFETTPRPESVKTDPRPESTTPDSVKTEFETTPRPESVTDPRPESTTPETVKTEFETTPRPESVTDSRPESVKTEFETTPRPESIPSSSIIIQRNKLPEQSTNKDNDVYYTNTITRNTIENSSMKNTPLNVTEDGTESIDAFGYSKLQFPIQSLNMIYPNKLLEADGIKSIDQIPFIVGKRGLDEVMDYQDNSAENTQPEKFNYNYKPGILAKYGRIFHRDNISKYSGKISTICDIIRKSSKGIIMIYSQYIDGGIVPISLALEEMGITRYGSAPYTKSLFQTPPTEPVDSATMKTRTDLRMSDATAVFKPAKYTIISGDMSFSPTNDEDIKYITSEENKYGELVKIVIISKAGAEGLDFRNIRQIHVMEPWYNMNRIEQIIGRGVRNLSHCSLPFEERNVEIFLHSSILPTRPEEECADTYVYRTAERKALQIGRVTRIIKETAVDCMLNIGQTNFSVEKFNAMVENQNIKIHISSEGGAEIDHVIGDKPYTDMCDYMDNCEYKCHVPSNGEKAINLDDPSFEADKSTFGLEFISDNNSRIIERIRGLFKERSFYTRKNLIQSLNSQRVYPLEQIYSSLTYLIQNKNEYLIDKYDRLGNLVNKGDVYSFQPVEITDENISIYERSVPIEYKRSELKLQVPDDFKEQENETVTVAVSAPQPPPPHTLVPLIPPLVPSPQLIENEPSATQTTLPTQTRRRDKLTQIIDDIESSYLTLISPRIDNIEHKPDKERTVAMNIRLIRDHLNLTFGITTEEIIKYSIYKLLDSLNSKEKLLILDEMFRGKEQSDTEVPNQLSLTYTDLNNLIHQYFKERRLGNEKHVFALVDEQENLVIFSYTLQGGWVQQYNTKPFLEYLKRFVVPIDRISDIFGFIEKGVFKIRDKNNKRNKGFDITQAGKQRSIEILNYYVELYNRQRSLFGGSGEQVNEYTQENTVNIKQRGICAIVEMLLRFIKDKTAGADQTTFPVVFLKEEELSIIKKYIV